MAVLPPDFKLENYFAEYEFRTRFLLCCSDVEALTMGELVGMADTETRAMWDNLKLSYTTSEGDPLLREAVAGLHGVDRDEVLIVCPQEGIYIAMHSLVHLIQRTSGEQQPHVIATYPAYQSLYENVKTLQCQVDYWTAKESQEGWRFDLGELKSMICDKTKLLVVNFPHNPTGAIPSKEEWEEIIEICRSRNILLFSDEMYRLTNNDGTQALESACKLYDNAVTLFGMSKTFALPGLRLGWLCTQNKELLSLMQSFKNYTTICAPGPSEVLALIALRNKDVILNRTISLVKSNLVILNEFMREFPELFEWHPPRACTTGLLRVKGPLLELGEGGASGFCHVLVTSADVLLLPSAMYDFPDHFVRISFGRADMPQALEQLRRFINKHVYAKKDK